MTEKSRAFLKFPLAGPRLRDLRTSVGRSVEDMARTFGVAASTLQGIERGRSEPSFYLLLRASRYFGVPLTHLAGENVEGLAS